LWSRPDREWLFDCLIDSDGSKSLPKDIQEGHDIQALRQCLANRPDVPDEAFGVLLPEMNMEEEKEQNAHMDKPNQSLDYVPGYDDIPYKEEDIDSYASSYDPSEFMEEEGEDPINGTNHDTIISNTKKEQKILTPGSLDTFFMNQPDNFGNPENREFRAELTVQETIAVILRASAMKKKRILTNQWLEVTQMVIDRLTQQQTVMETKYNETDPNLNSSHNNGKDMNNAYYKSMDINDLKKISEELGKELRDVSKAVVELDVSARRMARRLLDYSNTDSASAKAKQKVLEKQLDEHIANLPSSAHQPDRIGGDDDYVFGTDRFEEFHPMLDEKKEAQASPNQELHESNIHHEHLPYNTHKDDYLTHSLDISNKLEPIPDNANVNAQFDRMINGKTDGETSPKLEFYSAEVEISHDDSLSIF